jgi:8-oxo-dGTP pyrophosphatase MutT (NUDIX family)
MLQLHDTLQLLRQHTPFNAQEQAFTQQTVAFVEANPADFALRTLQAGHLTASAWVLSPDLSEVLLIHHAKLKSWFQPGGHVEATDVSLWAAALREATEETTLAQLKPWPSTIIFDIDIHLIPANSSMPAHNHHDIRFAFVAEKTENLAANEEVSDIRWIKLADVSQYNASESVMRMVNKTLSFL